MALRYFEPVRSLPDDRQAFWVNLRLRRVQAIIFFEEELVTKTVKNFCILASLLVVGNVSAVELITNGSLEGAGATAPGWDDSSSTFGTVICDQTFCGNAGAAFPANFDGDNWAWFGGIGASEVGSLMQQAITIPAGNTVTLSFQYAKPVASLDPADFINVSIDGTQVWSDTADTALATGGYEQQVIDVSSFSDGGTHVLSFESEVFGVGGLVTNFWVDSISLDAVPVPEPNGLALSLGGLLGMLALIRRKR